MKKFEFNYYFWLWLLWVCDALTSMPDCLSLNVCHRNSLFVSFLHQVTYAEIYHMENRDKLLPKKKVFMFSFGRGC